MVSTADLLAWFLVGLHFLWSVCRPWFRGVEAFARTDTDWVGQTRMLRLNTSTRY